MRVRGRLLSFAALLALGALEAGAQEITGTILGTVRDQTGGVVPGATVTVRNVKTSQAVEFVTNKEGRYITPFLAVGSYEVEFRLEGFKAHTVTGINLHVNDRLEVNGELGVGEMATTVEVTAVSHMLQATPAVQTLMGPTQVQELPLNNRNFIQLATLVPGVSSSLPDEVGVGLAANVSLSIAGARRNAVNYFVDGASNVDVGSNITLLSTPTLESIEEFKIITSSYAAEWPRSGGGIVNVVTKAGSNDWRFSGYEFYRNDSLNANNFFRKQTGCTANPAGGAFNCSTRPEDIAIRENPAELSYNNFGYTLGGPVLRDKVFFFFSQEWRKISRPATVTANVPDPAWLTDPASANYVAPERRDANAVSLLQAWPLPNLGTTGYVDPRPNDQDTRQEVIRVDWQASPAWRIMGRYTHDLSQTTEPGGLFFNTPVPGVATTLTDVPGHVAVLQATATISPRMLNEFTFQFSGNAIKSVYGEDTFNKREQYGLTIPELYDENRNDLIPQVAITGLSTIGANQLFDNKYRNFTFGDNLSYIVGDHSFKGGLLFAFEQKDELSTSATQGVFNFRAGGGRSAFQNFLLGNADGVCGAACDYLEPEREINSQLRWERYEFYVQDSWRVRPNLTLDLGLRYSLQPPITDNNDLLTNFVPERFDPADVPRFSNAAGDRLVAGTGDPLNGIVVAGGNSPHGRGIYSTDTNNLMPRLGFSWDLGSNSKTIVRGGFGIYYDQVLIGIFAQNAFVNPPVNTNPQVQNARLSNPGAGSAATLPVQALIATSDPFIIPKTRQWNVGVQRQLYSRGMIDLGYVGSAGDDLIQPVDINQPQPQDVVRLAGVNVARPYPGWAGINRRQTTAKARYRGLLVGFRHDGGRAGSLSLSYTLSQSKTDATNDRDAIDLPQNPLDLAAEYALARSDRTHVFTANYVYELPFFRNSKGFTKAALGGWQVSGITSIWTGLPISRVINGTTNGSRRGIRVNQASDPFANLPADVPGGVYWFNPAAFTSPADGQYGNTGRAIFRLPGVHQWDITLSKNWFMNEKARLQFRADFINAFNHTQFNPDNIQNTCAASTTNPTCAVAGNRFGQITGTRAPREVQLGVRLSWN